MNIEILCNKIQQFRESCGLTQEELAAKSGISVKHISVLERGLKTPRLATFLKIAEVLGVTPNDLLSDGEDNSDYLKAIEAKVAPLSPDKQEKIYKIICTVTEEL